MEFRLLGPVEVVARDCPVDLGHRRQRLVLAVLALEANRLVPIDRLIGLSWPTSPPRTATHAIQVSASQLRTALARASCEQQQVDLVGRGSGYMLRTDAMDVDAHRFRALVREARGAESDEHKVALLRRALRLWRGPVLTGIAPDQTRDALGRGLEEARLVALEDRIEAELRLARHRELLDELTGLVQAHPQRERLTGQLMLALYWSGQAGAALEAFRRTRQHLADELGIDPGAELRRLEMALLRNDATLAAPPESARPCRDEPESAPVALAGASSGPAVAGRALPAQLPPAVADFTGRAAELRRLTELIPGNGEMTPAATIVTITGPAGVGKSALAVRWAQLSRHRFGDGQLFIDLRGYAHEPPMSAGAALGRLLRALGVAAAGVPHDPDEAAALYRTVLADRRVLIVLDNAGAARQVRPLLPAASGCLVVITSRDSLAGLIARDGARCCSLDTLSPDEARALLGKILGPRLIGAEQAADGLAQACGYLPLALRIAAANLASRPALSISGCAAELTKENVLAALAVCDDEQASLREVLGLSYARLGQDARRLFRLTGVAPCQDLTARTAAALAGITPPAARRLLDQLASAHVLREHRSGRFAVSDMFRSYARELAEEEDSEHERASAVLRLVEVYATTAAAAWRAIRSQPVRLAAVPAAAPARARFTDTGEAAAWLAAECVNIDAARAYAAGHGMRALARQLASAGRSLPAGACAEPAVRGPDPVVVAGA